jgi:hypothetical protein
MPVAMELEQPPTHSSAQVRKARRFCFDGVPSPDVPLAVVGGGHEFCSPGCAVHRPNVQYYSVELVARGRGSLALNGKDWCTSGSRRAE